MTNNGFDVVKALLPLIFYYLHMLPSMYGIFNYHSEIMIVVAASQASAMRKVYIRTKKVKIEFKMD
jgi:hypothetical protein